MADIKLDRAEIEDGIGENSGVSERDFALWIDFMLASPAGTVQALQARVEGDEADQWSPLAQELRARSNFTGDAQVWPLDRQATR